MTKKYLVLFSIILGSFKVAFAQMPASKIQPFSPLTGPYAVGTVQFEWTDLDHEEIFTSKVGDKRVVVAQIWYPANKTNTSPNAPYLLSPLEFSGVTKDAKRLQIANSLVQTRSHINVPVATAQSQYPILIYNPGGANTRFLSSFVTEQLASHGFIVVAIEHYGNSMATHFPDGSPMNFDRPPVKHYPEDRPLPSPEQYEKEALESIKERDENLMPIYLQDTHFIISKIRELHRTNNLFRGRFNFDKLGALGWSFGGATSIQLLVNDRRFKAAANLDGQLSGVGKESMETHKPFLLLTSSPTEYSKDPMGKVMARLDKMTARWTTWLLNYSTGPRYHSAVAGTDHGSFSDWNILLAFADWQFKIPSKDTEAIEAARKKYEVQKNREQTISDLVVKFFLRHL
ncbi:MAG: alpha/beta hydrolase family protein [Bdellovibrionales bacterium]